MVEQSLLPTRRRAVLVVGYYRSGTSALSGALVEAGMKMPSDTEANEHNPKGFFEDTALIQFDMDLLNALGSIWSDLRFLPDRWMERADLSLYRERLAGLLRGKFGDAPLVALKHPHLCRLFPIYASVIAELGLAVSVIHTHRSPYVIATSQKKKNGLPRAHGLLLWASYMVDAERNTREVPRAWVAYEDLIADQAGTVRDALDAIGISGVSTPGRFVTNTLRRSNPAPAEGLFTPLHRLVSDIDDAIVERRGPEVWDGFRDRVSDLVGFLEEVGGTTNRAVPGIGESVVTRPLNAGATLGTGASEGHGLRPAERTDAAARSRITARLGASARPSLSVIVVSPAGMDDRCEATLASLRAGWREPDKLLVLRVGQAETRLNARTIVLEDDDALSAELQRRLNGEQDTEFVAILNAGDTVEPDAVARLALAVASSPTKPAMLYCDEIVASGEHPWIRTKPEWDVHRLRESCFVGDWVWYATVALQSIGGFSGQYVGAEEQDVQLRIAENGLPVLRVPEALFVRRPGTRRDAVPLAKAIDSATAAINTHLGRMGIAGRSRSGRFPGTFEVEYPASETAMVVGLRCDGLDTQRINLGAKRVLTAMKAHDRLVYLAPRESADAALNTYLERVATEVSPSHPGVQVRLQPATLGATLAKLKSLLDDTGYIALIDPAAEPDRDDQFDVLRGLLEASPEAGIAGVRGFWRDGETTKLLGPLLPGAAARIGANRDAENPGPGGWLAATQKVGAVDGPCLVLRTAALPDAEILANLTSWVEVCEHARQRGYSTLWSPTLKAECLRREGPDIEQEAASKRTYAPEFHHPALSLIGDSLLLESRFGLIEESPAEIGNLVTGEPGCHIINLVRATRRLGHTSASWAAEPLDPFSARRAMLCGRRWVRLNPTHAFEGAHGYTAVWTRPPSAGQHPVVKAAAHCVATSEPILRTLRGMTAKRLTLWQPRLEREIWERLPASREGKPVALWIDERVPVTWLNEVIKATRDQLSWLVISDAELALPGDVAKLPQPVFEDGWHDLFARYRPKFLVRPSPDANWLDDHTLLMGAAADCVIVAGKESKSDRVHNQIGATWLSSDRPDHWIRALSGGLSLDADARARILNDKGTFWLDSTMEIAWLNTDNGDVMPATEARVA